MTSPGQRGRLPEIGIRRRVDRKVHVRVDEQGHSPKEKAARIDWFVAAIECGCFAVVVQVLQVQFEPQPTGHVQPKQDLSMQDLARHAATKPMENSSGGDACCNVVVMRLCFARIVLPRTFRAGQAGGELLQVGRAMLKVHGCCSLGRTQRACG